MNVIWSSAAVADVENIRDYIAPDNRERAISFVVEITVAGEGIADMPRAFGLVPRLEHRGIRKRTFGRYLIFYRIVGESVQILHVVHGARDYIRALLADNT
jgi:plasmid stabilization system protein ParE